MDVFQSTLDRTLILFIFMLVGYVLNKTKILPESASAVLSKLENYILVPAVLINTFSHKFTVHNISEKWPFIAYSSIIICVSIPFALLGSKILGKTKEDADVYKYSFTISNFSFMGIALVSGAFGENTLFDYLIFILPVYAVCYSIGVAWLIPSEETKITFKSFLNPICISLVIGAALGLISGWVTLPSVVQTTIADAGACMGPVAMILTGFVIGGYNLKDLIKGYEVYVMSLIRLIIIPVLAVLILRLFNTSGDIINVALICLAMPLGLNSIVIRAAYNGDTKLGASFALVSSAFGIITIPIIFSIFMQVN